MKHHNAAIRTVRQAALPAISMSLLSITVANAQTGPAPSSDTSTATRPQENAALINDTIIVTATRRAQNLDDVPISISIIEPQDYSDQGLSSLRDVSAYVPGFSFSDATGGPRGTGSVSARGVGQQGATSVVGVYLDDIPMSSNSPFTASFFTFFDGMLGDVERVEMLRGPQGTLYGSVALGGAIKYVTRAPSLDKMKGRAAISVSQTKDGGVNSLFSGRFSVPLRRDVLAISLSGYRDHNAGFVDRINSETGDVIKENADQSDSYGVSGKVLYEPTDRLSAEVSAFHQNTDYDGFSQVNLKVDRSALYRPYANDDTLSNNTQTISAYSAALNYRFDASTLTAVSSYVDGELSRTNDLTSSFASFVDEVLEGNPPGTTTAVPVITLQGARKHTHEVRWASNGDNTWSWVTGLFYTDEDAFYVVDATALPTDYLLLLEERPNRYREIALFGDVTYSIHPNLHLTLGGRVSRHRMDLDLRSSGRLSGGSATLNPVRETVDTWQLAAKYDLTDTVTLYGRAASGYRPAAANILRIDPVTGENLAQQPLLADSLWSYELGARGALDKLNTRFDLSIWQLDWDNFRTFVAINGLNTLANAKGGIAARGADASITIKPAKGLTATSSLSYTSSELNRDEPGLFGLQGQQTPGVPKWTAAGQVRYQRISKNGWTPHIGAGFRYSSDVRSSYTDDRTYDPALGETGTPPVNTNVNFQSDDHFLIDAHVGISSRDVSLGVYATNLLDCDAYSSLGGFLSAGSNPPQVFASGVPVRPRTIGVTLTSEF